MWGNWLALLIVFHTLLTPTATLPVNFDSWIPSNPRLDPSVQIIDAGYKVDFGVSIQFNATVQPKNAFEKIYLTISQPGVGTRILPVQVKDGQIHYTYDIRTNSLRPFAPVTYWYEGYPLQGSRYITPTHTIDYIDSRFNWQNRSDDTFQIYWYEGDPVFGQMVINVAEQGLLAAQDYVPVQKLQTPVRIFVYASATDLQQALSLGQQTWVAGHTSTDLRTILISIAKGPEQRLEMERQIPHELTHILQYEMAGADYQDLPPWLIEGSASLSELHESADYARVLKKSVEKETLLPISAYCSKFPRDASGAFQAYAELTSFVRYLYQKYGVSKMMDLFQLYKDGLDCEKGFSAALGDLLSTVETRWHQESLRMNIGAVALGNLMPYLLLLLLVVVPPILAGLFFLRK